MRSGHLVSAVLLLLAACADTVASPSVTSSPAEPPSIDRQPPVDGLPHDDARLEPILSALRANPAWLDEPIGDEPEVLALVPGAEEVCVALRGREDDVIVTIDPALPWRILQVALDRGEEGRQFTFDPAQSASDVCTFVLMGRASPWPEDAALIEVTGSIGSEEARAIAEAVHAAPERFGIDRHGVPAVNVGERIEPAPDGWTCSSAEVYVGGPRSSVIVGTRRAATGWQVEVRVVAAALRASEPPRAGHC